MPHIMETIGEVDDPLLFMSRVVVHIITRGFRREISTRRIQVERWWGGGGGGWMSQRWSG